MNRVARTKTEVQPTPNETYRNWTNFLNGEPRATVVEAKLYTTAQIYGELEELGPYSYINTIAHAYPQTSKPIRPAIVVRVAIHVQEPAPRVSMKDDYEHYHGGDFVDEIAALASLFLGIRLKAGSVDREFHEGDSPYGRPIEYGLKPIPELPIGARPQIPRLSEGHSLIELAGLNALPTRSVHETNALVKVARLYQQAVWIADSDPALAWLLLVSAVETAAVVWAQDGASPRDAFEASLPDLFNLLGNSPCADLIDQIAEMLSKYTGATRKFIGFLVEFCPKPPEKRPVEWLQFSFENRNLKRAAGVIYEHRSKNLHSGTSFPEPLCTAPSIFHFGNEPDNTWQEVPTGLATSAKGATWTREKTPMLLHTFEYIARGALLAWWNSLGAKQKPD